MGTENRNNHQRKEIIDLTPAGAKLATTEPHSLSPRQAEEIKKRADRAVKELVAAEGSAVLTVADQIANVGIQDQKTVSTGIALLQEKMGTTFYSDKKSDATNNLTKSITELQGALARINPKDIQNEARYRIIRAIPFFGNWIVRVLKESSNRRLTLQEFIEHLEDSLKSGELILKQDNAQLKVMYNDLEGKQDIVGADAFYAETLMKKLEEAIGAEQDEKKKGQLQKVLFRVATRAQDLRAMENIHEQFFVSIEMTKDNNDMLVATVQRMLTMGMNVVLLSCAIHAALMRQTNVLEAARGTRDFLGKMILSNATTINKNMEQIGDIYKEPIVAMEMMEKATAELEQAIDKYNKLQIEAVDRAKDNIVRIKDLTKTIKDEAGKLPVTDVKSLEAREILELPAGRG